MGGIHILPSFLSSGKNYSFFHPRVTIATDQHTVPWFVHVGLQTKLIERTQKEVSVTSCKQGFFQICRSILCITTLAVNHACKLHVHVFRNAVFCFYVMSEFQ